MRTNDRTLLASLGFQDPDKKETRHDKTCQFIALNAKSVMNYILGNSVVPFSKLEGGCGVKFWRPGEDLQVTPKLEVVITKGDGIYKSHVGFIDCTIQGYRWFNEDQIYDYQLDTSGRPNLSLGKLWITRKCEPYKTAWIGINIEVKVLPVSFGDMVRQIKFYREYTSYPWVLVTAFVLPVDQKLLLNAEGIHTFTSGELWRNIQAEGAAVGSQGAPVAAPA